MTLTVTTALLDRSALFVIEGELDLAGTDLVPSRFEALLAAGVESVVIDLSGVTFLDAAGLSVLLACREQAAAAGAHSVLTGAGRPVTRVMDLTRTRPVELGLTG
ncbi:STAS domain-containing protein [Nocardioides sp. SYSU DS0663]|uniref:STAS domain-containing protein n=1 Tax=Nocardioides sp. SYSU DS0663 TaxID=3416445 RepID=UPI003F4B53BF